MTVFHRNTFRTDTFPHCACGLIHKLIIIISFCLRFVGRPMHWNSIKKFELKLTETFAAMTIVTHPPIKCIWSRNRIFVAPSSLPPMMSRNFFDSFEYSNTLNQRHRTFCAARKKTYNDGMHAQTAACTIRWHSPSPFRLSLQRKWYFVTHANAWFGT